MVYLPYIFNKIGGLKKDVHVHKSINFIKINSFDGYHFKINGKI